MTVKQLAADYIERHAIPHKKPSSLKNDQRMLKAHILPAIGKLRVSAVQRGDLEKLLHPLGETPVQSNRVRGLLLHMFSLAVRWNLRDDNPCERIRRFPEKKREKPPLTAEEFEELRRATNRFGDMITRLVQ
jgi:hypothetical protein